ncbi:MAG: hypothetical protein ACTHJW_13750 [Streptosporangiaceae bacterium]
MPDDRLRELFAQVTAEPVHVPPVEGVLARGQQRRRRVRLQASTAAWTILLATGFGAPQVSGSLGASPQQPRILSSEAAPATSYPSAHASGRTSNGSPSTTTPGHTLRPVVSPSPSRSAHTASVQAAALPPPGHGRLILGVDSAHEYVMTRVGSAKAPVRVAGLTYVAGAPPVLATNPAGGWVVAYASRSQAPGVGADRLALVVASGHRVPFGPLFVAAAVTSAAVSRNGSRVAVAVTERSGGARIEVLPLPGHQVRRQSWSVPAAEADLVTALSWSPDGHHLSYLADQHGVPGSQAGPVILDTAARMAEVPDLTRWPLAMKTPVTCLPQAATWLGTSRRLAVLSACMNTGEAVLQMSDARTGLAVGQPLVVSHSTGCEGATLNSNASGSVLLISYCGVYLDNRGTLTRQPADLTAAALAG